MRGLSDRFLQDLQEGVLKGFLNAVKDDDTLSLEIRDNYVNIYYRGGNLCKIAYQNGSYVMGFNGNYTKTEEHVKAITGKEKWVSTNG